MYESSIVQLFAERARLQGKRKQGIEDVVEVLAIRFTPSAAEPLKPNIEAIDDLQTLKALHRSAIQAPSLDEFKQTLNSMTNGK